LIYPMTDDMEYFGGTDTTYMDIILPDVEFQYFEKFFLVAEHIDALFGIFCDLVLEYPEPIFRAEHDMVFAFIDRVL
jgi:hypothetical protein